MRTKCLPFAPQFQGKNGFRSHMQITSTGSLTLCGIIGRLEALLLHWSGSSMTCRLLPCSPVLWCRTERVKHVPSDYYDLAPDGERVLVLMPVETQEAQGQNHVIFL